MQRYWLMKSEPNPRFVKGVDVSYSIDHLMGEPNRTSCWDGVRNAEVRVRYVSTCICVYVCMPLSQARNLLANDIHVGDMVFFYHSNCKEPGIAGIMEVSSKWLSELLALSVGSLLACTGCERGIPRQQPV